MPIYRSEHPEHVEGCSRRLLRRAQDAAARWFGINEVTLEAHTTDVALSLDKLSQLNLVIARRAFCAEAIPSSEQEIAALAMTDFAAALKLTRKLLDNG